MFDTSKSLLLSPSTKRWQWIIVFDSMRLKAKEGWPNTAARLAGWRRVIRQVWFCTNEKYVGWKWSRYTLTHTVKLAPPLIHSNILPSPFLPSSFNQLICSRPEEQCRLFLSKTGLHLALFLSWEMYSLWLTLISRCNGIITIAGHRPWVRCRRHRYSGILYLSPVTEHSDTGLGPLNPVPNWFHHQHFCSFRYRTDWMPDRPTFRHLKKWYTLLFHTACVGSCERDTQCTSKLQVV